MRAGPKKPIEVTHMMESYLRELVGLVESGRSMMDAEVLRLSQEIDQCINLIYRQSPNSTCRSPLQPGDLPEQGNRVQSTDLFEPVHLLQSTNLAEPGSTSRNAASASPSSNTSLPLIM